MFGLSLHTLLAFSVTSLMLAAAPGPDNLGVLSLGLSRGRRAAAGFAFGCASGCLTHTLLAAIGVSAIIMASEWAFQLLKYAGAAYLLYLAYKALKSSGDVSLDRAPANGDDGFLHYTARGLLANAINPKVALFFLAFLPQFVDRRTTVAPALQIIVLGTLFALSAMLVFQLLALFSASIGAWLRRRQHAGLWLDRLTGGLFIVLAARLALAER